MQDPDTSHLKTAAIGHNRPDPLEALRDELAVRNKPWLDRVRELLEDSTNVPASVTDANVENVQDFVKSVKACVAEGDKNLRPKEKEPYLSAGRTVDGFFATLIGDLHKMLSPIEVRLTSYLKAKADREKLERDALAAMDSSPPSPTTREPSRAELSRSRGAYGSVASLRSMWTFRDLKRETLDLEKLRPYIPAPALETAVRAYIKAGGRSLKGVEIVVDEKAVVR